jgi:hypothetical protein
MSRAIPILVVGASLAVLGAMAGCGGDRSRPTEAETISVPPQQVDHALGEVDTDRLLVMGDYQIWQDTDGHPGSGWDYSDGRGQWERIIGSYSSYHLGSVGEVRDARQDTVEIVLTREGLRVPDWEGADRVVVRTRGRHWRYVAESPAAPPDPYSLRHVAEITADLSRGETVTFSGTVTLTGEATFQVADAAVVRRYTATSAFHGEHGPRNVYCPDLTHGIELAVSDAAGTELDRYQGTLVTRFEDGLFSYGGRIESLRGPGAWITNLEGRCER